MSKSDIMVKGEYKGVLEIDRILHSLLQDCSSDDELRYFMNRPYFDKEKKSIVATDGRRLIKYELHEAEESFFHKKESGYYTTFKDDKKYYMAPKFIDGTFPSWERVVPDYSNRPISTPLQWNKQKRWNGRNSLVYWEVVSKINAPIDWNCMATLGHFPEFYVRTAKIPRDKAYTLKSVEFTYSRFTYIVMPLSPQD